MKEKIIEGYVNPAFVNEDGWFNFFTKDFKCDGKKLKARIIIEQPERVVSISESEFKAAMFDAGYDTKGHYYDTIKGKLFKKEENI